MDPSHNFYAIDFNDRFSLYCELPPDYHNQTDEKRECSHNHAGFQTRNGQHYVKQENNFKGKALPPLHCCLSVRMVLELCALTFQCLTLY